MSKYQRDKGANYERELANLFKSHGFNARRGLRQWQDKHGEPDVVVEDLPGLWIEAKKGKKTYPIAALNQAKEACSGSGIPVAICKDDYDKTTVTMEFDFFVTLLKSFLDMPEVVKEPPLVVAPEIELCKICGQTHDFPGCNRQQISIDELIK